MAAEKELDLIDDYLRNRMGDQDKAVFENTLQTNPSLKAEYELQQRVVEGIRQARKAELKAMLNNVPITAGTAGEGSAISKVALGILVTAAVGTGIYFYANSNDKVNPKILQDQNTPLAEEPLKEESAPKTITPLEETPAVSNDKETPRKELTQVPKEDKAPTQAVDTKASAETQTAEVRKPTIDAFSPEIETDNNTAIESIKSAESSTAKASKAPSIPVEVDDTKSKLNFHYQFKEGKLFLYGAFDKNLYEILEFFSDNKHTMFLYYKNNYYLLNEGDEKVKPLTALTDPLLLKKLQENRAN